MRPVVWTFAALADIEGIRRYIGNFILTRRGTWPHGSFKWATTSPIFPIVAVRFPAPLRETTLARPDIIRCRVERVLILRVRHGARRLR